MKRGQIFPNSIHFFAAYLLTLINPLDLHILHFFLCSSITIFNVFCYRYRLEWETAVVRGSRCFQALEEERLKQLKHLVFVYWQHCRDIGPKLTQVRPAYYMWFESWAWFMLETEKWDFDTNVSYRWGSLFAFRNAVVLSHTTLDRYKNEQLKSKNFCFY